MSLSIKQLFARGNDKRFVVLLGGILAFIIFLTTLQLTINGSSAGYMVDVGEIQNALPRWGTIHFPGYPLYSLTGSVFVSALRLVGVAPAAGSSLYSAFWGAITISLLISLELHYDVPLPAALFTSLLFGLSASFWMDASIAEVHTMTIALMLASIIFAVRFGRSGRRADLIWFSLFTSQALLHQRALVFLGLALLILILQQQRALLRGLPAAIGVALLGSLIYLYLPVRAWMGAEWTFNQPGTWQGFWSLVFDTKTGRIIEFPATVAEGVQRVRGVGGLLSNEWPLLLLACGLIGIVFISRKRKWLEVLAISLIWLPYVLLSFIIWVGRIADALLAVNIPVFAISALGLGVLTAVAYDRWRPAGIVMTVMWALIAVFLFIDHRSAILAITRDNSAQDVILVAEGIQVSDDSRPNTLMALWGHDYWALAYAKEYQGRLNNLNLVDHNADLAAIIDGEDRLLTLNQTFYLRPLSWWDERFGNVYLSSYGPGVIEVDIKPPLNGSMLALDRETELGNGLLVRKTETEWISPELLQVTVFWEAGTEPEVDYSVAIHLVDVNPPAGPDNILAQADNAHPVDGWYPTSRWTAGELVKDVYLIDVPPGSAPVALRLAMYQVNEDGNFVNTKWLTMPLERP